MTLGMSVVCGFIELGRISFWTTCVFCTRGDFESWKGDPGQYTKEFRLQHYHPQKGDVVIDVGAGRGEDALTFSRTVGRTGRVIAIEAHPLSFKILQRFCLLNELSNVTLLPFAAMDKPGTVG